MLARFYAFSFASRCYFYLPILVLWFFKQGFTQTDVMRLLSIYFVSALAAEIPTGLFADRCGRKWALVAGSCVEALGAAALAFATTWPIAALAEALLGCGQAFHTGAKEALLYDHLKDRGIALHYQSAYAHAKFFEFVAMSVGALCGAPLYLHDGRWPFWATAAIFALGGCIALRLREPPRNRAAVKYHWRDLRTGWREVRDGPPAVRGLIGYYAWFFSLVLIFVVTLSQPYLVWIGVPLSLFGVAYLYFNTLAMAGTVLAHRLTDRAMGRRFFLSLGAWFAGVLFLLAGWRASWAVLAVGGIYFGWGLLLPTISAAVNRLVGSERRATVLSIQDFFQSGVFVATAMVAGYVADAYGLPWTLVGLAAISIVAMCAVIRVGSTRT